MIYSRGKLFVKLLEKQNFLDTLQCDLYQLNFYAYFFCLESLHKHVPYRQCWKYERNSYLKNSDEHIVAVLICLLLRLIKQEQKTQLMWKWVIIV